MCAGHQNLFWKCGELSFENTFTENNKKKRLWTLLSNTQSWQKLNFSINAQWTLLLCKLIEQLIQLVTKYTIALQWEQPIFSSLLKRLGHIKNGIDLDQLWAFFCLTSAVMSCNGYFHYQLTRRSIKCKKLQTNKQKRCCRIVSFVQQTVQNSDSLFTTLTFRKQEGTCKCLTFLLKNLTLNN